MEIEFPSDRMEHMREQAEIGEYYHVYNKALDSLKMLSSTEDAGRFLQCMEYFNSVTPIGSIFEHSFFKKKYNKKNPPLVDIVCYCVNQNHFHLVLQQRIEQGIEKYMHRIGVGYTKYYNQKYKRRGPLFVGSYHSKHIDTNEYLLHVTAYVNLNNKVHKLGNSISKSSWDEYTLLESQIPSLCSKDIILEQFRSKKEYSKFALDALITMREKKKIKELLLE